MYNTTLCLWHGMNQGKYWRLPPGTYGAPPDTESNMYNTTLAVSDMEWLRVYTEDWRWVLMVRRLTLKVTCIIQHGMTQGKYWGLAPGTNGAPPDTESNMYNTTLAASDMEWLRVKIEDWRRVLMVCRLTLKVICIIQPSLPLTWNDSG